MKFPTREPRSEKTDPWLNKYPHINYYDHETVIQDDGTIAKFIFENHKREDGWRYSCIVDKWGFRIWTEEDHSRKWDENTTFEQLLLESIDSNPHYPIDDTFKGNKFEIADDEEIHAYVYGGVLSKRGGWFVVKKNNPKRIIRSIQTWLS